MTIDVRVAACVLPRVSHFNTSYGLLAALRRRGHEVRVFSPVASQSPYVMSALRALGIDVVELEADWTPVPSSTADRASLSSSEEARRERYRDSMTSINACAPRLRSELAAWQADVVTTDPIFIAPVAAATALAIPYACIHTCLSIVAPAGIDCARARAEPIAEPIRRAVFEQLGVTPPAYRYLDAVSPHVNLVWHVRELVGETEPRVRLAGPTMARPFPEALSPAIEDRLRAHRGKVAFVGFGSLANHDRDLYARTLAACAELGCLALVSCPDEIYRELSNPWTVQTTAQLAALARADVHLGGVGAVSLMESYFHGVPIVALPHAGEQEIQAHYIERTRTGIALPAHASVAELAAGVAAVLDGPATPNARALGDAYRRAEDLDAAAREIERLA